MTDIEASSQTDTRWVHQPLAHPIDRPAPSKRELAETCGKTAALILATECDATPLRVLFDSEDEKPFTCEDDDTPRPLQLYKGKPLIAHAINLARESELASIAVIAGGAPEAQKRIEEAVRRAAAEPARESAKENAPARSDGASQTVRTAATTGSNAPEHTVRILPYDRAHDRKATAQACGFALFDYTVDILEAARSCLEATPDADSVLLLACDEVRIMPAHVLEVCKAFRDDPALSVITSWITWESREPALISRAFLESLPTSPLVQVRPGGLDRPLPSLHARQVVFGEEKLAANAVKPAELDDFFAKCTLSAREAVRTAREELRQEREKAKATDEMADGAGSTDGASANTSADSGAAPADPAKAANPGASSAEPEPPKRSAADQLLVDTARAIAERLDAAASPDEQVELAQVDAWAQRNRLDFPILNDHAHAKMLAYLDSAATSQRVACALQAQANFDTHENANVYRGSYELSSQATLTLNDARKALEDFIGSKRRHTAYTANTSASCNLVAQAWGDRNVHEGDLIVATLSEHHSNLLPWQMLAQRKGARLAVIPLLPDGRLDMDAYEKLLSQKPKIVCVAHVSNVLGLENPVQQMARATHAAGARFLLDAAQSFAHLPIDVEKLEADFVAFSAHKAYGPMGIGGLWIADDAFDEMDPVSIGGGSISHAALDSYYLRTGAIQYEVGTPPVSQAIGWAGAIDYLRALGTDAIERHAHVFTRYLVDGLHGIENVTVWGDHAAEDGQCGLVSFSVAGVSSLDLGSFCGKLGVAIRSGSHCAIPLATSMGVKGTGRASFGVHTTKEDLEALLVAVSACEHLYWERP